MLKFKVQPLQTPNVVQQGSNKQNCSHGFHPLIPNSSSRIEFETSDCSIIDPSDASRLTCDVIPEESLAQFSDEFELKAQNYSSFASAAKPAGSSGFIEKILRRLKAKPLLSPDIPKSKPVIRKKSVSVQVGPRQVKKPRRNNSGSSLEVRRTSIPIKEAYALNGTVLQYENSDTCLRSFCCVLNSKKPNRLTRHVELQQSSSWFWRYKTKYAHIYDNNSLYQYKSKFRAGSMSFIPNRMYNYGEKGSGFQTKGQVQDFYEIRDRCLQNGELFEDPEFPAANSSLFFSQSPDRRFEWKRPGELVDNPQLFVEGFSRFDVQQGELGDCWLLAAVANLTLYRRLFFQIVPDDQNFEENYAGVFHFRFWQYGRWIDVVIDDRLPTYRGQLVFLHSTEENEFWSALLEKAYAKLHGSYEALKGGSTCEAMEDFTGGVTEMYEMDAAPPNLFKIIVKAYERWSLMGCSIEPDPNVLEAQTPEGLIRGHAYSITKVQYVDIQTPNTRGKIPLLRLRNPWGNDSEWNGPWSDHSPEWQYIADDVKEQLGLNFDGDGEFWMSFKDFQRYFSRLEICNLNPDSLSEDELCEGRNKKWEMSVFEGEWVRGVTAGGCRNFLDTFSHNPQYTVTLTEVDEGDDEQNCTMIVALMQKNRRQIRSTGGDLLTIGFAIYHLPYPDRVPKPLDLNFFKYNASVARSPSFINLREVSCRFKLPPGTYCIVPSTFDPNEEGEFILRVFSENQNNMEENDQEIGLTSINEEVKPKPTKEKEIEKHNMYKLFREIAGADNEVDWIELKSILDINNQNKDKGFSKDCCRSMIAMLDTDRSGRLNFDEFEKLWENIQTWNNVFKRFDKDNSGTLSGFELREAFSSAGYNLNNHTLNVLMHRYGNKRQQIDFDDFIMCATRLKKMIDLFHASSGELETATFTKENWIETTLYS